MPVDDQRQVLWNRVHGASARMLWAQSTRAWWGSEWPEERKRAWQHLERALLEHVQASAEPEWPNDPTRHLLIHRGPDNRPITLAQAARKWRERVRSAKPVRHPTLVLAEHPESPRAAPHFFPGECLLLHRNWWAVSLSVLRDLDHRMAPGRPGYTVGEDAAALSQVVHQVADGLRAPFTETPTPHPGDHPDATPSPAFPVSETELDRLCAIAQEAALQTPTRQQLRNERGPTVSATSVDTAAALSRILSGADEEPWVEVEPGVNPAHTLAHSAEPMAAKAEEWRPKLFAPDIPPPYTPTRPEPAEPADRSPWKSLSHQEALVLADSLDEFAARITPGRTTPRMRFDSLLISVFYRDFERHLA